jgi:LysM repeat protein
LTGIAKGKNAGICDIAKASGITNVNLVEAGRTIYIPKCKNPIDNTSCLTPVYPATELCVPGLPSTYTVVKDDTLSAIAGDFNITLSGLLAVNTQIKNPDVIEVAQVINIPVCPSSQCDVVGTYLIAAGDLYVDLAQKHGSTIGQIKALNVGVDPTKLYAGQQIILPQDCHNVTTAVGR